MKALLVAECRKGKPLSSSYELVAFAEKIGADTAMFVVGNDENLPNYEGTVYLADAGKHGEFNPDAHKKLLLGVIEKEQPELVVFCHSSYGWDLAPRVANALGATQVSEVVDVVDGTFVVPVCNGKLRRSLRSRTGCTVLTLQVGAFNFDGTPSGNPTVEKIDTAESGKLKFTGYEEAQAGEVDLSKAEIIVSAGRGIGKPENLEMIKGLAKALKGEYGASRPVVDAEWADHSRQVGTTGQTVSPKLYIACGISGAIQHLAGMKKSDFVIAINTDKDAPIGEVADVLVIADVKLLVPALTEKLTA